MKQGGWIGLFYLTLSDISAAICYSVLPVKLRYFKYLIQCLELVLNSSISTIMLALPIMLIYVKIKLLAITLF